ncbi:MAG: hypothetical protein AAGI10_02745 [Pseudomonadota bacterium]
MRSDKEGAASAISDHAKEYLVSEMGEIRSQIDSQFREHEKLQVFSASAFGVTYWSVISFDLASARISGAVLLMPLLLAIYGFLKQRALSSFTKIADDYVAKKIEKVFLGESGGWISFYEKNRTRSLTRVSRDLFWISMIAIAALGVASWASAPELFLKAATS